jgi:hypothetical protein
MKKLQKEVIKDLYKSAEYERKEKIKECFPEVFEQEETIHLFGNTYKISLVN